MDKQWTFFLLFDVAVIIAAARGGGWVARQFRQPPVIVVDRTGISEEALGDRADRLFLPSTPKLADGRAGASTTASSLEGR